MPCQALLRAASALAARGAPASASSRRRAPAERHHRQQPGHAGGLQDDRPRSPASDATVLITGETGTGKELVAAHPAPNSPARDRPLRQGQLRRACPRTCSRASCSATRRAPSPARCAQRKGRFELADGGTIFLDEIGDIAARPCRSSCCASCRSASSSASAARRRIKVDVRVIAATNRDLRSEVAEGSFREDLYYRLNVVTIDAAAAARARATTSRCWSSTSSTSSAITPPSRPGAITEDALDVLDGYDWPGNVRELENTDRARRHPGPRRRDHGRAPLPGQPRRPTPRSAQRRSGRDARAAQGAERGHGRGRAWSAAEALQRASNRVEDAASLLGLSPGDMTHRLRRTRSCPRSPRPRSDLSSEPPVPDRARRPRPSGRRRPDRDLPA